jgi:hypothetical protein
VLSFGQAISGGHSGNTSSLSSRDRNGSLVSKAWPLHFGVPPKIRERVWENKYVDFGVFLKTSLQLKSAPLPTSDSDDESLNILSSKGKPLSLLQWQSAFDVFTAVYALKYPDQVLSLVRYSAIIKEINDEGGDWRFYDEKFRAWREEEPIDWQDILHTAYLKALARGKTSATVDKKQKKPFRGGKTGRGSSLPKGSCWKFQRTGKCDNRADCKFTHTCARCQGAHPSSKCKKPAGADGAKQGDAKKSKPDNK